MLAMLYLVGVSTTHGVGAVRLGRREMKAEA
jgi:hypothetical protein